MKKYLAYLENPKYLALFVAAASAAALTGAYISQYGFGLDPCALCFYQRKPYFVNIALGVLAFIFAERNKQVWTALLVLAGLSFLVDAGIAGFHAGVEYGWWKGLEACSNFALPEKASLEELRKFINSRGVVRCDVPAFTLLGISMAGFNFLYALLLAFVTFYFGLWRKRGA